MALNKSFTRTWVPPRALPFLVAHDVVDCLHDINRCNTMGYDVRDLAFAWCRIHRLSDFETSLIMEPYLNGFWKFSDGLSVPDIADRFMKLKGRSAPHGLEHHPVGVRHDYDWRIGISRRISNRRFRRLAERTDFTRREARRMAWAVATFGFPIWIRHQIMAVLNDSYTRPPWS